MEFKDKGHSIETLLARKVPWAQLPEWYRAEPHTTPEDRWFLDAFWVLGTERHIGFTLGPIPESRIEDFAVKRGLDRAMVAVLKDLMHALDNAYLKWLELQRQQRKPQ